jgi:uncharacterized protein YcfL
MIGWGPGLVVTLLAGLIAGCAAIEPPPPPALPPPVDTRYPGAKLVIGAPDLLGRVAVIDPLFRKRGALNEAIVTIQNLTEATYTLEYLFEWEDEAGFTVDQVRVWQPFTLTPHQIMKVNSTGPTPEASMDLPRFGRHRG